MWRLTIFFNRLCFLREKIEENNCSWQSDLQLIFSTCFFSRGKHNKPTWRNRQFLWPLNQQAEEESKQLFLLNMKNYRIENRFLKMLCFGQMCKKIKRSAHVEAGVTLRVTKACLPLRMSWNWPISMLLWKRDAIMWWPRCLTSHSRTCKWTCLFFSDPLFPFPSPTFGRHPGDVTLRVRGESCCGLG